MDWLPTASSSQPVWLKQVGATYKIHNKAIARKVKSVAYVCMYNIKVHTCIHTYTYGTNNLYNNVFTCTKCSVTNMWKTDSLQNNSISIQALINPISYSHKAFSIGYKAILWMGAAIVIKYIVTKTNLIRLC